MSKLYIEVLRSHHTIFHKPMLRVNDGALQQCDVYTYDLLVCLKGAGFSDEELTTAWKEIEDKGSTTIQSSTIDLRKVVSDCHE